MDPRNGPLLVLMEKNMSEVPGDVSLPQGESIVELEGQSIAYREPGFLWQPLPVASALGILACILAPFSATIRISAEWAAAFFATVVTAVSIVWVTDRLRAKRPSKSGEVGGAALPPRFEVAAPPGSIRRIRRLVGQVPPKVSATPLLSYEQLHAFIPLLLVVFLPARTCFEVSAETISFACVVAVLLVAFQFFSEHRRYTVLNGVLRVQVYSYSRPRAREFDLRRASVRCDLGAGVMVVAEDQAQEVIDLGAISRPYRLIAAICRNMTALTGETGKDTADKDKCRQVQSAERPLDRPADA